MTEMAALMEGPPGPPGRGRPGRPGSPGPQGRPGTPQEKGYQLHLPAFTSITVEHDMVTGFWYLFAKSTRISLMFLIVIANIIMVIVVIVPPRVA